MPQYGLPTPNDFEKGTPIESSENKIELEEEIKVVKLTNMSKNTFGSDYTLEYSASPTKTGRNPTSLVEGGSKFN